MKNKEKLEAFYRKLEERENLSLKESFAIYDALYEEAVALGAISSENIMDGLEVSLKIAKAINRLK